MKMVLGGIIEPGSSVLIMIESFIRCIHGHFYLIIINLIVATLELE